MIFVVEPLHEIRHPGEPALDPHQLQLRKALGQPVDDPVGHVDQAVVHERQRVHGDEAVELREGRIAPVEAGMERERLAGLLDHRIELHVADCGGPACCASTTVKPMTPSSSAYCLTMLDAGLRRVERKVDQALEPLVLRQDALDEPAVVGAPTRHLDVVLRMHAERQHRRREHDLVVEAHRVHGAARQLA